MLCRYVAHTFNFYVFPREQGTVDPRFSFQVRPCRGCHYMDVVWVLLVSKVGHLVFLQASNVDFLCCHKFDFNKVGFFISNIA